MKKSQQTLFITEELYILQIVHRWKKTKYDYVILYENLYKNITQDQDKISSWKNNLKLLNTNYVLRACM